MIVRDDGLGVPQTAHSGLAGQLAAAWRIDDDLPAHDLLVAATIHDIGWTDWERSPAIDPSSGRPWQFYELPGADHAAIWSAGTDAASSWGRWVSLLVSLHCVRLMTWREEAGRGGPEVAALIGREEERCASLRTGLDPDVVDRASVLIATWDGLSLELCGGGRTQWEEWPFTTDRVDLSVDAVELDSLGGPQRRWRTLALTLER
jgi:hypothetical protein